MQRITNPLEDAKTRLRESKRFRKVLKEGTAISSRDIATHARKLASSAVALACLQACRVPEIHDNTIMALEIELEVLVVEAIESASR